MDSLKSANTSEASSVVLVNGFQREQSAVGSEAVSVSGSPQGDALCIVGMACRLPGDISSPADLWQFLVDQKSAQGTVPAERYNIEGYYHPDANRSGSMNVPGGYFIKDDVREFDNSFFGINNLEATYMDPQQRKLLQVVYECLQSSGTTMESVSGSKTGVFVANFSVDFQPMQARDPDYIHRYQASGSGATIMSNRISHVLNLQGPSFTVDTACSSSVYALHQAANAIKTGDCESAIVASANLIMSPEPHIGAAKSGVLSPTGTCHTFDASADGYGRAEAVNAIYIKRLSAALRDGNPIRAIIRGSAINANGRTPGISLPSGEMQEVVMRQAYREAGLKLTETDYVECHGTGTPVGDPIEVDAVGRCFSRPVGPPLLIGSVKTNVGHSEGASGLTSIIKVVKSMEEGRIAPSYGVKTLNPKLVLAERNVKVATQMEEWPRALRRASINSFGYGGANAHVILESTESYLGLSAPKEIMELEEKKPVTTENHVLLPVSAGSANSLKTVAEQVSAAASRCSSREEVQNLAYTLTHGRDQLSFRGYVLASVDGTETVKVTKTSVAEKRTNDALPYGFVFTGQGAQYAGMAKELLSESQLFLDTIHKLDKVLQALPAPYAPSWTLEQTLLDGPETSRISDAERSQPICTAVQIGLVEMLRSYGIKPTSVVGHSSGEMAAAYAAGMLSASQAILVAYFRGFSVKSLTSKGRMMAAGLGPDDAKSLLEAKGLQSEARVACVNSPESVTLSGSPSAIDALEAELTGQGKFARKLETNGRAYHSHMMEEIGPLYQSLIEPVLAASETEDSDSGFSSDDSSNSGKAKVLMFSSVGHNPERLSVLDSSMGLETNAAYWRQNLEQPVQFSSALKSLAQAAISSSPKKMQLIEIGPHSALKGPIQQIRKSMGVDEKSLPYLSTLIRKENADAAVKTLAGSLFVLGHSIELDSVNKSNNSSSKRFLTALAPYPWDYSAGLLWNEPRTSIELRNRKYLRHELLGTPALTGNGIDYTWRNCLKPKEMPWIEDHKLEDQVVFPGAGYMAMAIEAVSQVTGIKHQLKDGSKKDVGFELRNVNISAALVIPSETDEASKDLELHTTMSRRKISGANASADWHDFNISSIFWTTSQTKVHCTGSIRVVERRNVDATCTTVANTEAFDHWATTGRWYTKWHQEGLQFGPQFRSLTTLRTDSARVRREAIATAKMEPTVSGAYEFYPVHPITIDAGLQAACLSGTAGKVTALKTWLPVFFAEMRIQSPTSAEEGEVHVRSEEMGFSSGRIDGTIRDANGALVVDYRDGRMARYTGKNDISVAQHQLQDSKTEGGDEGLGADPVALYTQRQPTLRVEWHPDVLRLGPESGAALRKAVDSFVEAQTDDVKDDESLAVIGALLTLVGHKQPRMRVLEVGGGEGYKAKEWQHMLGKDTAFPRIQSWQSADLVGDKGELSIEDSEKGAIDVFDVVLIPKLSTSKKSAKVWAKKSDEDNSLASMLSDRGVVIMRKSEAAVDQLEAAGFNVWNMGAQVVLAVKPVTSSEPMAKLQGRDAVIVHSDRASPCTTEFAKILSNYLQTQADVNEVNVVGLEKLHTIKVKDNDLAISLLEVESEFLASISPQAMDDLRRKITDVVPDLLWITGAGMLGNSPDPTLTLSSGLSRAVMLEQPRLRWSVLDIGSALAQKQRHASPVKVEELCSNVVSALVALSEADDCEFISVDGLMHISRYTPDVETNSLFRRRIDPQMVKAETQTLASANPARLTIGRPGVTDTMYFQQTCEPGDSEGPAEGYVDIEVKAVSLNAKDVYAMAGRVETRNKTTAFDFAGVVSAVGPGSSLNVGTRVVAYAPFHIGTTARVPVGCVHPLLDHESFTVVPTLLVVYATALYALHDRAHIRKGESVLIHAGSGGFGIAAIAVAKQLGATVYTTCGSQAKRDYLVKELGVPESHIFSSRDDSFVQGIATATGGRGVDVILNSLVGDLMHCSWEDCLADFGRFVEVGKRELIDAGRLDMRVFLKNATFTAFDLSELFYATKPHNRAIWDRLMVDTLELYRAGKIEPLPTRVFDITEISQAYRYFGNKDRVGKVVISMEDSQALVPVAPPAYLSQFDSEKIYLLAGCLGGLGRSLSRWMMSRGARHFVFLGRSGAAKPSAKQLVDRLEQSGATVHVVRGDVCKAADVTAAVAACVATGRQIGGIVQAAMGLHEALYTRMTNEAWHTGIDPKYQGTWNLHNAVERVAVGYQLDFFLLTSSISGTVGTATESNYCAANGFLDAFARWRRSRGQPCVSVGLGMISEVGYLHENPEIEALLLRKGIQPLNEDELLQVVDLALASEKDAAVSESHLLTGLEADGLRSLTARGFDVTTHGVLVEARAAVLLAAFQAEQEAHARASSGSGSAASSASATAAPWFKDCPTAAISAALASEASAPSMQEAILNMMKKRFSSLILMPLDQVDERKALPEFGVDSMIASEFRSWFWAAFRVDVPFLHIMSAQKSLLVLAEFVEEAVVAQK